MPFAPTDKERRFLPLRLDDGEPLRLALPVCI